MDDVFSPVHLAAGLCLAMLICLELGRRVGLRKHAKGQADSTSGLGIVEGAVFGLYGLLVALTFSGAPARFDLRRQQIAEEANAIGTAYLRVDLLPAASQPAMREQFRNYVDSRLDVYRKIPDMNAVHAELARSAKLQNDIWAAAVAATQSPGAHPDAGKLLLPALNEMIDITTTRTMAAKIHPPMIVFALLFFLALACSLIAGYRMAGGGPRSWLHIIAFVAATVVSVYVILEIEYPRRGVIRIDAYDQVLVDVRRGMD